MVTVDFRFGSSRGHRRRFVALDSSPKTARIDEIGITLRLGPNESYGYDAFTMPEWRGRGIQSAASAFKTRLERSCGLTRHISYARAR